MVLIFVCKLFFSSMAACSWLAMSFTWVALFSLAMECAVLSWSKRLFNSTFSFSRAAFALTLDFNSLWELSYSSALDFSSLWELACSSDLDFSFSAVSACFASSCIYLASDALSWEELVNSACCEILVIPEVTKCANSSAAVAFHTWIQISININKYQ